MYTDEICAKAAEFSGSDQSRLRICAEAAELMLRRRLREGVSPENIKETFVAAAALMALSICYAADEGISWSAGAASLSLPEGGDAAGTLAGHAEALLEGYLEDGDMRFLGVDG